MNMLSDLNLITILPLFLNFKLNIDQFLLIPITLDVASFIDDGGIL